MDTKKLRQKILDLAIHGKLVPQDPNDEPASVLLERIRAEKEQLIKEGKKYFVNPYGVKLEVDGEKAQILADNGVETRDIILGFRPEHVDIVKENGIPVSVLVNEMMGSEIHLHVLTSDNAKLIVRVPTVRLTKEEREGLTAGKELQISFPGKVMHFFDPETEKSLLVKE